MHVLTQVHVYACTQHIHAHEHPNPNPPVLVQGGKVKKNHFDVIELF